jgi:hypothetical protein
LIDRVISGTIHGTTRLLAGSGSQVWR